MAWRDKQRVAARLAKERQDAAPSKPNTQAPIVTPAAPTFDASRHRPSFVSVQADSVANAKAVATHHKMSERMSDAWRSPANGVAAANKTAAAPAAAAPVADANAAYQRLVHRQSEAWKTVK